MDHNTAAVEFWSRYCAITRPILISTDEIGDTLRTLRQGTLALLDRKAATPLDHVTTDETFTAAHAVFVTVQNDTATYNQAVEAANTAVGAKKAATSAADVSSVENALIRLLATKKRHERDAGATCQDYQVVLAAKKVLEEQKASMKNRLDKFTQEVIGQYEQSINRLLDDFQASFRITGTKHGYPGGRSQLQLPDSH